MEIQLLAKTFNLKESQVENTVKLIDEGNTIPFISRYRKEVTGGLDDEILRALNEKLEYIRSLEKRKEEVMRLIEEQDKLTDELKEAILAADVLQRVEDLYKPFKQKKRTKASMAKEKGLEPLALMLYEQKESMDDLKAVATPFVTGTKEDLETLMATSEDPKIQKKNIEAAKLVFSEEEALEGAHDIIAEIIAEDANLIELVRAYSLSHGKIKTKAVDPEEETVYEMYYAYEEPISTIQNHRIVAINRGEKEKKLKVSLELDETALLENLGKEIIMAEEDALILFIEKAIQDGYKRLLAPSVEREIRNSLTEKGEKQAAKIFAQNLGQLLLTPPVKEVRILSLDPGFRTGCKVAVIDETGKLLAHTTIYPTPPKNQIEKSKEVLLALCKKHHVDVIAIGNGTASRETEQFVSDAIKEFDKKIFYTIVNEAGASIYSASKLATEEYPELDVTVRGAMSIGKRLQDPLAELVKIDPKHIGVGQYQHDINQSMLTDELNQVVEKCVNQVGVDLNTASSSLLQHISGINKGVAKNIITYREAEGSFKSRKEIKKVPKLGLKAYEQCAGFVRISQGSEPLDATSVHPESYAVANQILESLGIDKETLKTGGVPNIEELILKTFKVEEKEAGVTLGKKIKSFQDMKLLKEQLAESNDHKNQEKNLKKAVKNMAEVLGIGMYTLEDIIKELKKPGRDIREDMPSVIFRGDVVSFEDLEVGMELTGVIRNVVDFGAFVDIGVKQDGLVHISQLSDKFVKHPMDVVSVGDSVTVRILEIDHGKERIGLTMKALPNKKN